MVQTTPQHLKTRTTEAPRDTSALSIRSVVAILVASAAIAVLLEAGTLYGAPAASPLVLSQWIKRRIAVFFLLALPFVTLFVRAINRGLCERAKRFWGDHSCRRLKQLVCEAAACVGIGVAACLLAFIALQLAGVAWDNRYGYLAGISSVALALLIYHRKAIGQSAEWGFLIISLSAGITMCLLMPTIAEVSWDGQIHFDSSVAMSYVCRAEYTGADVLMCQADAVKQTGIIKAGDTTALWTVSLASSDQEQSNSIILERAASEPIVTKNGTERLDGATYVSAAMVGRIPNAIGLWTGRLFHLDSIGQYFLGRLASVICYCLVFFFAIRGLRSGKLIVSAIGLIPVSLLMAANFSYDPWCTSWIALSLSRFARELQYRDRKLTPVGTCAILIPFILGALVKAVLFPLALVFLMMPKDKFASKKAGAGYRACVVLSAGVLVLSFVLPFLFSTGSTSDVRGGSDVSSPGQVAGILAQPLGYASLLVHFYGSILAPRALWEWGPLVYFAYVTIPNSLAVSILSTGEIAALGVTTALDRNESSRYHLQGRLAASSIVGIACSLALIATALYVSFTPVGLDTILGVQYRYLIPLLCPLLLICINPRPNARISPTRLTSSVLYFELVLLVSVIVFAFLFQM